jgi:predicted nucleotidyltransferase
MVDKKEIKKKVTSKKPVITTLNLKTEHDIALDFATKVYKKMGQPIKSIVLFGSTAKKTAVMGSDIDVIIIIDDVSINWDVELTSWYREELEKLITANPYKKSLHINTVKLSTWWEDILKGDPTVINILRYGEPIIDLAGFFEPLKYLLIQGKIKGTPEAIYSCLQRAPSHIARSKMAELGAVEGIYWSMIDSAHAALISSNVLPASPEHIAIDLKVTFVDNGRLKVKHVENFKDVVVLYKKIAHNEVSDLKGVILDDLQQKAEDFLTEMVRIVKENIQ